MKLLEKIRRVPYGGGYPSCCTLQETCSLVVWISLTYSESIVPLFGSSQFNQPESLKIYKERGIRRKYFQNPDHPAPFQGEMLYVAYIFKGRSNVWEINSIQKSQPNRLPEQIAYSFWNKKKIPKCRSMMTIRIFFNVCFIKCLKIFQIHTLILIKGHLPFRTGNYKIL
jgi:hypothetical protein